MDHDQRFKALIREFFADFLRLFFADWAARFDLNGIEWLDKEVLPNPPEGSRHVLDLVARLPIRPELRDDEPESTLSLVHIEIEAPDQTTRIKPRLPSYYVHLRDAHSLPVLPIVIYLKVGLDGIGIDVYEERFWKLDTLRFSYLYVGLPALDAQQYVAGENWLGIALAALMRIPADRAAILGAEALRRIMRAPLNDQKKFLLAECIEAYLPVDEQQLNEVKLSFLETDSGVVKAMNKTSYDYGLEDGLQKGRQEGRQEGVQNTLLRLGAKSFGPPSRDIEERVRGIQNTAQLEELVERILDVNSWDDLLQR